MAALNIVGGFIIGIVKVPIFLDMIGTMVVAVALGPWWGALTGIITNTAGSLINGPVGIPFALCNVVGALVWGYGIRSFGLGKSLPGLIVVGAVCGIAVQAMAAPIITFVFGGATGHSSDALVAAISLPGSFADKLIATFVGLAILQALPSGLTAGVGLPKTDQNGVLKYVFIGLAVGIAFLLIAIQQAGASA
jgi:energy-coupling factor transport system substrate-specific component